MAYDELRRRMLPFSPADILGKIAALQLTAESGDQGMRLRVAAAAAASLPPATGNPPISNNQLAAILHCAPMNDLHRWEDPLSTPWAVSLPSRYGPITVLPGTYPPAVRIYRNLQVVLQATNLPVEPLLLVRLRAVLDGVAMVFKSFEKCAGFNANFIVVRQPVPERIKLPDRGRFEELCRHSTVTEEQWAQLCHASGLPVDCLDDLTTHGGSPCRPHDDGPSSGALAIRPIVRMQGKRIHASPADLLLAAVHGVLRVSREHGCLDTVMAAYMEVRWLGVQDTLVEIGNLPADEPSLPPLGGFPTDVPWHREALFGADLDKVLYVLYVPDSASAYDSALPHQHMEGRVESAFIAQRLHEVDEHLNDALPKGYGARYLVLTHAMGRSFALRFPNPKGGRFDGGLCVSADMLELLALHFPHDQLSLWRYADARARAPRTGTIPEVMDEEDVLAYYLLKGHEFPTYGTVKGYHPIDPGGQGLVSLEIAAKHQPHWVESPDGDGLLEVVTVHGTASIPIYRARGPGFLQAGEGHLVERLPGPVWVMGPRDARLSRLAQPSLVDLTSYWIWRFNPWLSSLTGWQKGRTIIVRVKGEAPPSVYPLPERSPKFEEAVAGLNVMADGPDALRIELGQDSFHLFADQDGKGEALFVRKVMAGILELVSPGLPAAEAAEGLDKAIAEHGPYKERRRIHFMRDVEPWGDTRLVVPIMLANMEEMHHVDDLLRGKLRLGSAPILAERTSQFELLDKAKGLLLAEFERKVALLRPLGLLELLVAMNESLTHYRFYWEIIKRGSAQCFPENQTVIQELVEQNGRLTASSTGLRFLLEYVAARPPQGSRPLSLKHYEELIALATRYIEHGTFEAVLRAEPRARLRLSSKQTLALKGSGFQAAEGKRQVHSLMRELFDTQQLPGLAAEEPVPTHDQALSIPFDQVHQDEFGVSVTEIMQFLAKLTNWGLEGDGGPVRLKEAQFVECVAADLGWDAAKVRSALSRLTLGPRDDFWQPTPRHGPRHVAPWYVQREFSCLNRPIMREEDPDGAHVVWGHRHLYACAVLMGRRLAAGQVPDSGPWGQERGTLVNRLGLEFEDEVAAAFGRPDFTVRRRVGIRDGQRNLGDVDVFVYDHSNALVLLCECKRLERQITPQGFTFERERLAGKGAESATRKQLDRAQWVRANLPILLGRLDIAPPTLQNLRVVPLVVVREENLTRFAVRQVVPLVTLAELEGLLATGRLKDLAV